MVEVGEAGMGQEPPLLVGTCEGELGGDMGRRVATRGESGVARGQAEGGSTVGVEVMEVEHRQGVQGTVVKVNLFLRRLNKNIAIKCMIGDTSWGISMVGNWW